MRQEYGKVYRRAIDVPIGLCLAGLYLVMLLATTDVGFCRDEGYYFYAGERYITWVEQLVTQLRRGERPPRALQRKEIRRYWEYNYEHPPLAKLMIGGSWWLFSKRLKWMSNATGFRFPGMLWACLIILLIYLWGTRVWNRRVGLFAAVAMMLLPRFFFHAHLAAFDVPIAALWFLVCYAFWRGMKSAAWGFWCGIFFGLALATKHNAWILPVPLALFWLCQVWNKFRYKQLPDGTLQVRFAPLPNAFYSSLVFGPLVLFALWPLLWPANPLTLASWKESWMWLTRWISFHLKHVHYDAYYFGTLHMEPPFPIHFPFGMTIVTFPLVTVLLCLAGTWFMARQQRFGIHVVWWTLQTLRALFALIRPLLGALLTIFLWLPVLLVWPLLGSLWAISLASRLIWGRIGAWVRRGTDAGGRMLKYLQEEIQLLQRLRSQQEEAPKEYKPRPVGPADKTGLFWLMNASIPIAVIALPSTPIFGGTKHWMPAWPFLALLAGVAFERILASLHKGWFKGRSAASFRVATVVLGVMLLAPAAIGMVRSHPHGLAYYNTLVGGPRGSANWKLQRYFWAPALRQAIPWMSKNLRGEKLRWKKDYAGSVYVSLHDTNWSSYNMYCRDGLMRCHRQCSPNHPGGPCVKARWSPYAPTRYFAFIHQKWLRSQLYHNLAVLGSRAPVYGVYIDGAPLLTIWEKSGQWSPVWW